MLLDPETLDLVKVVKDAVDACQPLAEPAGCDLHTDLPECLIGRWDLTRVEQIVTNLVANACRYAPASRVVISLHEAEGQVRLAVEDDGPGVRPDLTERIFEPFVHGNDKGEGVAAGLGLGLYIVQAIANAHGGACWVETGKSSGARFVVTLPKGPVQEEGEGG